MKVSWYRKFLELWMYPQVAKTIKRYDETGSHEDRLRKGKPTNLYFGLMSPNLRFLVPNSESLWDAEKVSGWFLHVLFPLWIMKEEVWWCGVLSWWHCWWFIQNSRHTYPAWHHSILQRHAIPSGLCLLGPSFVFQQDNDPNTPPG